MSVAQKRLGVILAGAALFAGFLLWFTRSDPPAPTEALTADQALPALVRAGSPHLNTGPQATYLGNAACADCHRGQHETYLQTSHSRALAPLNPDAEPPDAEFRHAPSGRWYKVYRRGGKFRHRESIRADDGSELVLNDHPIDWVIGSGNFSRSYLVEQDGFLIESPITWYARPQQWRMSPGYDQPQHESFERLADTGCLTCHAGQVEAVAGNRYQPRVLQQAISCESCHGPGSLHVATRTAAPEQPGAEADLTIVNPRRLSRELSEAICANCHLRGDATVLRRGLRTDDFRPGLPLDDFRIDFTRARSDGRMEVVGHVEQMRQSRCYTESRTLTCTSCHDPHHQPPPTERADYFRRACLECHAADDCAEPHAERIRTSPRDSCAACHMPPTDTDIPHFAFTHHRIGRWPDGVPPANAPEGLEPGQLQPAAGRFSTLPQAEQNRLRGLAYLEFAERDRRFYDQHLHRSRRLLTDGDQDADALAALSRILWEQRDPQAESLAMKALAVPELATESRVNALVVRAGGRLEHGDAPLAEQAALELTKLRRHPGYWQLLADIRLRRGDLTGAIAALETAVTISPQQPQLRQLLGELYQSTGRPAEARRQHQALQRLSAPR